MKLFVIVLYEVLWFILTPLIPPLPPSTCISLPLPPFTSLLIPSYLSLSLPSSFPPSLSFYLSPSPSLSPSFYLSPSPSPSPSPSLHLPLLSSSSSLIYLFPSSSFTHLSSPLSPPSLLPYPILQVFVVKESKVTHGNIKTFAARYLRQSISKLIPQRTLEVTLHNSICYIHLALHIFILHSYTHTHALIDIN